MHTLCSDNETVDIYDTAGNQLSRKQSNKWKKPNENKSESKQV